MIIKEKSLIANYYKWMFKGNLANDFCTLFWNTLFSVLLLPLTIPAFIASFIVGKEAFQYRNLIGKAFRGLVTYFVATIGFLFGLATFEKMFGVAWKTWGFWPVLGASIVGLVAIAVILALGIGVIVGIVFSCTWLVEKAKESSRKKIYYKKIDDNGFEYGAFYYGESENKLVGMWNGIRNKYCTKIEWKE